MKCFISTVNRGTIGLGAVVKTSAIILRCLVMLSSQTVNSNRLSLKKVPFCILTSDGPILSWLFGQPIIDAAPLRIKLRSVYRASCIEASRKSADQLVALVEKPVSALMRRLIQISSN